MLYALLSLMLFLGSSTAVPIADPLQPEPDMSDYISRIEALEHKVNVMRVQALEEKVEHISHSMFVPPAIRKKMKKKKDHADYLASDSEEAQADGLEWCGVGEKAKACRGTNAALEIEISCVCEGNLEDGGCPSNTHGKGEELEPNEGHCKKIHKTIKKGADPCRPVDKEADDDDGYADCYDGYKFKAAPSAPAPSSPAKTDAEPSPGPDA